MQPKKIPILHIIPIPLPRTPLKHPYTTPTPQLTFTGLTSMVVGWLPAPMGAGGRGLGGGGGGGGAWGRGRLWGTGGLLGGGSCLGGSSFNMTVNSSVLIFVSSPHAQRSRHHLSNARTSLWGLKPQTRSFRCLPWHRQAKFARYRLLDAHMSRRLGYLGSQRGISALRGTGHSIGSGTYRRLS